jgi:hypothetical protein
VGQNAAPEVDQIAANFVFAAIFRQQRFNLRSME